MPNLIQSITHCRSFITNFIDSSFVHPRRTMGDCIIENGQEREFKLSL